MTVRTAGRPHAAASLHAALNTLRAHGLRVSSARRIVLTALLSADRPVSAEEIAGGLDGLLPPSDLASVYRNLETLEAIGLVQHVHLGHGPGRYALSGRSAGGWATCEACGRAMKIESAALEQIRAAVRQATGFDARFSHFPVVGLCPECITDPEDEGALPWPPTSVTTPSALVG